MRIELLRRRLGKLKRVYQPIRIEPVSDGGDRVRLTNLYGFTNLKELEPRWTVTRDGIEVQSGRLEPIDLVPGGSAEIMLPIESADIAPAGEYWLRLSFHLAMETIWAPAGHEVAWQQMLVKARAAGGKQIETKTLPDVTLRENEDEVRVEGSDFAAVFSRSAGTLTSLVYQGKEMLAQETDGPAGPILQACALLRAMTKHSDRGGRVTGGMPG